MLTRKQKRSRLFARERKWGQEWVTSTQEQWGEGGTRRNIIRFLNIF